MREFKFGLIFSLCLFSVFWAHGPAQASPFNYGYFDGYGGAPYAYVSVSGQTGGMCSTQDVWGHGYNDPVGYGWGSFYSAIGGQDIVDGRSIIIERRTNIMADFVTSTNDQGFRIGHTFLLDSLYSYFPNDNDDDPLPDDFVADFGKGWFTADYTTGNGEFTIDPDAFGGPGVPVYLDITTSFFGDPDFIAELDGELIINGVAVSDPFNKTVVEVMSGDLIDFSYTFALTSKQYTGAEYEGSLPSPYAIEGGFSWDFTCRPVPIPGAVVLLGSGLLGLAGLRKKLES